MSRQFPGTATFMKPEVLPNLQAILVHVSGLADVVSSLCLAQLLAPGVSLGRVKNFCARIFPSLRPFKPSDNPSRPFLPIV
jgi:hypothetical protein